MSALGTNLTSLLILGMAFLLTVSIIAAVLLLLYGLFFKKRQ
jgi:hypothetical protein